MYTIQKVLSSLRVIKMVAERIRKSRDACRISEIHYQPIAVHFGNEIVGEFIADMNC